MKIRKRLKFVAIVPSAILICMLGCQSRQPARPPGEVSESPLSPAVNEVQIIAEKALGPAAEVLLQGDLARNGLEQVLVVNQYGKLERAATRSHTSPGIVITRAVLLEKRGNIWVEVLRCDERVKNPRGYLGGISAISSSGWILRLSPDRHESLRLEFIPAPLVNHPDNNRDSDWTRTHTITVQWNAEAKLYQSFDRPNNKYLSELPALETPQSILR